MSANPKTQPAPGAIGQALDRHPFDDNTAARAELASLRGRLEKAERIARHIFNGLPETIENPDGYSVHLDLYWIDTVCHVADDRAARRVTA